jgi:hypothetical protein
MRVVRILALSLFVASAADAAPLTAKLADGPGTTGGGEFYMTLYDNGNPVETFITFCLQKTQYIDFTTTFTVQVSTAADDTPAADPIESQTAWLYTMARAGTLAGYDHSQAAANALQKSIWYFEGEVSANPDLELGNNYDFVGLANAAVANGYSGIGDVRVANMFFPNGAKAQDQLMLVPEPSTMALFGMGAFATALRRKRSVACR